MTADRDTPKELKILLLRHPSTKLNEGGPEKEHSRGHLQIPPDPKELDKMVDKAVPILEREGVKKLWSSSLKRASVAAKAIGREADIPVDITDKMLTWDTGNLSGKLEKDVLPKRKKYAKHSDEPIPGGESFDAFMERWTKFWNFLENYAKTHDDPPAAMGHGHHFMSLESMLEDRPVEDKDWDQLESRPPGSVIEVSKNGEGWKVKKLA